MMGTLVRKLLLDVRLPLVIVALILTAFQCLWAKITDRISGELVPTFTQRMPLDFIKQVLFQGPGKIVQTIMGGEAIHLDRAFDMLTIGYVHPLMLAIFCIWAIGRASGAVAGEIDRGTMELLLAQPIARYRVILAHLCVDFLTIPVLCLSLWAGTWLGTWMVGMLQIGAPANTRELRVDPTLFGAALWNVGLLLFAVSGLTMWLSAAGRFRGRVLGVAVLVTLLQFLVNLVGQMWDAAAPLRPFTVFYYYQPQQIILTRQWSVELGTVWNSGQPLLALNVLIVLAAVGAFGYGMALWTFCRRDLPAPL
jgi:ABC-2 type transport system permease protein